MSLSSFRWWCELLLNSIRYSLKWNGVLIFMNGYLRPYLLCLSNENFWLHNITMVWSYLYQACIYSNASLQSYGCVSTTRELPYLDSIHNNSAWSCLSLSSIILIHYFLCLSSENRWRWGKAKGKPIQSKRSLCLSLRQETITVFSKYHFISLSEKMSVIFMGGSCCFIKSPVM